MRETIEMLAITSDAHPQRQEFRRGMRVVLADGPWCENPRAAGHYGKIVDLAPISKNDEDPTIQVQLTGHVDGQPINMDEFDWYWMDELTVVD